MDLIRRLLPFKDIGWPEIGEIFTRFTLVKSRWGAVYLHRLYCPNEHPHCHDHPWSFVTVILRGGYWEKTDEGLTWRRPGSILYRPAEFRHTVITTTKTSWSLVIVGRKRRSWGFVESCRN